MRDDDVIIRSPEHWRNRAKRSLRMAQEMDEPDASRMREIAEGYERLARKAEQRERRCAVATQQQEAP